MACHKRACVVSHFDVNDIAQNISGGEVKLFAAKRKKKCKRKEKQLTANM